MLSCQNFWTNFRFLVPDLWILFHLCYTEIDQIKSKEENDMKVRKFLSALLVLLLLLSLTA